MVGLQFRLEVLVNFIPDRLTWLLTALSAALIGEDGGEALRAGWPECRKLSRKPSGCGEAALAGALGVQLGPPSSKPRSGEPDRADRPEHGFPSGPDHGGCSASWSGSRLGGPAHHLGRLSQPLLALTLARKKPANRSKARAKAGMFDAPLEWQVADRRDEPLALIRGISETNRSPRGLSVFNFLVSFSATNGGPAEAGFLSPAQSSRHSEEDMERPRGRSTRYQALDAWRGIVCLIVVLEHAAVCLWQETAARSNLERWFREAVVNGLSLNLGAPLFFVISGYCIASSLESSRSKGVTPLDFWRDGSGGSSRPYWVSVGLIALIVIALERVNLPGCSRPMSGWPFRVQAL